MSCVQFNFVRATNRLCTGHRKPIRNWRLTEKILKILSPPILHQNINQNKLIWFQRTRKHSSVLRAVQLHGLRTFVVCVDATNSIDFVCCAEKKKKENSCENPNSFTVHARVVLYSVHGAGVCWCRCIRVFVFGMNLYMSTTAQNACRCLHWKSVEVLLPRKRTCNERERESKRERVNY